MGIILDIVILLVFLLYIVKCYRQPQLRGGLETVAYMVALAMAVPISNIASNLAYVKLFRGAIAHNLDKVVEETRMVSGIHVSNLGRVLDTMPTTVQNAAESYQILTEDNIAAVDKLMTSNTPDAAEQIVDIIARPVIEGIFRSVLCVLLFCGLLYLMKSLAAVFENALYSPERAAQNTVLCAVFGCFKALVVITLAVSVIQLLLPALPSMPLLNAEVLGNSFLFKLFYHQNILMLFLGQDIYPMTM